MKPAAVAPFVLAVALLAPAVVLGADPAPSTADLFATHCGECHGADHLGAMGPALLPENLGRLKKQAALEVIAKGRPATQMPGFDDKLSAEQIAAVTDLIYQPLAEILISDSAQITASHVFHNDPNGLPEKPAHRSDPLNLFTVVETGDHHVTILDGDRFEPIWRFPSRFALHGRAKYSPDGRFVYLASRDGWVSKYDLYSLQPVAEIRVGINTRNIAVSSDGKWVMAGNMLPHSLAILNARDLSLFRVVPVQIKGTSSRVSAVYDARPRQSFVVALKDIKEIWELSYDPDAPPVYNSLVRNYRDGEVEAMPSGTQPFAIRRIETEEYLDDFFFDPTYIKVIGAARNEKKGVVYRLDVRRKIADLDLTGMPHLGSGIVFPYEGRLVMATPHLKEPMVSIIDMESWKTIKTVETLGSGFFMRSHENTPYAWVDVFFGKDKDAVHVIDKRTLEIVKTLRPEPGETAAHVEFTKDGRYALVSIWEDDGALVIYDAATLQEVKRLPMRKPSGKYNVFNKITLSGGTSH